MEDVLPVKLPRWDKNSVINHEDLNRLAEAIERQADFRVDGSSGLVDQTTATGRTLSFVPQLLTSYALVTTVITAYSGPQMGSGMIQLGFVDDNMNFVSYGDDPTLCLNNTLASIAVSQNPIQVKWISGYWAVDVVPCNGSQSA